MNKPKAHGIFVKRGESVLSLGLENSGGYWATPASDMYEKH